MGFAVKESTQAEKKLKISPAEFRVAKHRRRDALQEMRGGLYVWQKAA
jgi:hypothetical protein